MCVCVYIYIRILKFSERLNSNNVQVASNCFKLPNPLAIPPTLVY